MAITDLPPPHVSPTVVSVSQFFLQVGGTFWTVAYVLFAREALRTKTYGMPLFSVALNFGWELIFALYVAEVTMERVIFVFWIFTDLAVVYSVVQYGAHEWKQSPVVARNLGKIMTLFIVVCTIGQFALVHWWIENDISKKEYKTYRGVVGPDVDELGFWTSLALQAYLSAASLAQLIIRGHSGGVSWGIWAARTLGTLLGLFGNYGNGWYFWPEAHYYFVNPFAIFLATTALLCDTCYAFVLWHVQKTEIVLSDGRKAAPKSRNETGKDN